MKQCGKVGPETMCCPNLKKGGLSKAIQAVLIRLTYKAGYFFNVGHVVYCVLESSVCKINFCDFLE